jgi:hypothetical protein
MYTSTLIHNINNSAVRVFSHRLWPIAPRSLPYQKDKRAEPRNLEQHDALGPPHGKVSLTSASFLHFF